MPTPIEAPYAFFTPVNNGLHCVEICEGWDADDDCTADSLPSPDHQTSTECIARYFDVGGCTPGGFNLNVNSMTLIKDDPLGLNNMCAPGELQSRWAFNAPPRIERMNVHEILDKTNLTTDRMTATPPDFREAYAPGTEMVCCNPAPNTPDPDRVCIVATLVGPGVGYYATYQSDCGSSIADVP